MRIFLGFFGLTRSLRYTIHSIRARVFAPLVESGIAATRYGHFHLPVTIVNSRSGELGLLTDPTEANLLELQHCKVDAQEPGLIAEAFELTRSYPDCYYDNYASARNICFQLRSLNCLWNMMREAVTEQDWVVFLRPDLLYLDRIDVPQIIASMEKEGTDLAVPAWQGWGGLNDRFAVATARGARVYATRVGWLEAAAAAANGVHAETLLDFAAAVEQLRVGGLPARAVRIRANGHAAENDLQCFGLLPAKEAASA
jgi:hypothetical protein